MATITHAGRPVCNDNDGGWVYTPAAKATEMQVVLLARASTARVKDMGQRPAVHRIEFDISGSQSYCRNAIRDLTDLYDGTVGTLSVPAFGSISNTVFTGQPSISAQQALSGGDYLFTISVELTEL